MLSQPVCLAIFDVDHTLIKGDSLLWFGKFLLSKKFPALSEIPRFLALALTHVVSDDRSGELKTSFLKLFASGIGLAELSSLSEQFAEYILFPRLYRQAMDRIRWHKSLGHQVVFLSASPAIYLEPLAETLTVDAVIATRLKWRDGIFYGDIEGANCKGQEKFDRLLTQYQGENVDWQGSFFYADSIWDLPVFEYVGHPVIINPNSAMARIGTQRQWQIEHWM